MSLGVLYGIIASFLLTIMMMFVKLSDLSGFDLTFARCIFQLLVSFTILKSSKLPLLGKNMKALILRGIFGYLGLVLYFVSLKHLPFSNVIAIQNMSPIFSFLIAVAIGLERFRVSILFAIVLSFTGVLYLYHDLNFESSKNIFYIGTFLSAFFAACAYTTIRHMKYSENTHRILFYFSLVSVFCVAPFTDFANMGSEIYNGKELVNIFGLLISSYVAHYFLTKAFQQENVSKVSITQYFNIVFGCFFGYLIFNEEWSFEKTVAFTLILLGFAFRNSEVFIQKLKLKKSPQRS